MVMRILSSLTALTLCLTPDLPAAGELDTNFNPNVNGEIKALALAPDGKIFIGGSFTAVGEKETNRIARLLPDGQRDPNWSNKTAGPVPSCVVLADGSVLVGDQYASATALIYRFLPDGSLDQNPPIRLSEGQLHSMALESDGNLLVAGSFTTVNNISGRGFASVAMDGAVKPRPITSLGGGLEKGIFTLLPSWNGSIQLGGNFTYLNEIKRNHLARIGSSGTLDSLYAPSLPVGSGTSVLCMARLSQEGAFLAGGSFSRTSDLGNVVSNCLARFFSSGTLDTSFSPLFTHSTGVPKVTSVAVQTDGKIIVAGDFTGVNGIGCKGLVRLESNGAFDRSFSASATGVTGLALQADGKIIITGNFLEVNGVPRKRIARLHNNSTSERLTLRQNLVSWSPLGSTPQCDLVDLEVSTDGRVTWQPVAKARSTSSSWIASGIDLPLTGTLRFLGRTSSGLQNGSSGLVQKEVSYSLAPEVDVRERTPTGTIFLADGQTWPLDYGDISQGSPATKTLEIYNGGSSKLTVTGIQLPAGFAWLNPPALPATINPVSFLTVTVQADATALGNHGGTAVISTDDVDEASFEFPLAGMVTGPDIAMHLGDVEVPNDRAEPISFARGYQGTPQMRETLTISNQGNRDLEVSAISAGAGFTVDAVVPFSLHPGESRAIQVGPDQSIAGTLTGNLEIYSNDADEPVFRVPLTAQVLNPLVTKVVNTRTKLNRKSGLREQKLRITNPTKTAIVAGFRVIVRGLPEWVQVRNASEILPDGSVVIEVHRPLGPLGKFEFVLEYEIPKGSPVVVFPALTTEVILDVPGAAAAATLAVEKCERDCEGHFAVTFRSAPGRRYQVEYSADGKVWKPTGTRTRAAGSIVRWVDCGCPHTECAPKDVPTRFYRVRELE